MQSDTFLVDTDSDDEEYDSDSSGGLPKNNNLGVIYDILKDEISDKRFLDQSSQAKYNKLRNELFTPKIIKGRIVYYSYHTDDSTHKDTIDLADQYKLNGLDNVIGFEMISARILPIETTNMVPFIDLVIPEIPHIACKQNEYGIPIINRLNTDNNTDVYNKNDYEKEYNNYFTPIKLSTLTLKLFGVDGTLITSEHPKIIYEFEITVLNLSLSQR